MAPTNVGEEVLDLVIPYIHNVEDRNSVSLVSRKFYEVDGITHLETLARTRGKDLGTLKIKKCKGFSTDGLRHVSKYCNQLRTLCLGYCYHIKVKDAIWLHQLALNNTGLERFHVTNRHIYNAEDLTLLATNCCNSLISLKIGACYLSKLGDAFRYAVRLEHFGGDICDAESELVGFRFPPNIRSLSRMVFSGTQYMSVLPLLIQIRKLKLVSLDLDEDEQCLLYKRCPNLEVLYTVDVCGDTGLQVIGKFCKKLRKFANNSLVTHVGMIALAKGCTNLECLDVILKDISNEALECVGTHLKNLRDFRIRLGKEDGITILPLDYGVRAMLMGCSKLERLDITLRRHGRLTDVGLEFIGKYGVNLRSLSLECVGNSNAGLVKLSRGCQNLRKLKLFGCPFSKLVVTSFVFNILSLRYVWGKSSDRIALALTRPQFEL
ncbi:leucine-rich repeat, cysteine-containing subtype protein [Tanacetum coccineum]|uniref:Leucine-rich repeat, cysteine-containing subtype protein n=1 Tax=Tanacetum coccineum TaxID=301880 RepID=A0ABQ5CAX5_9ASTR